MRPTAISRVNVLVPIKRCVDYAVKIRVNADRTGVDTNVKHSMNPFDEIAVEEAVALRQRTKSLIESIKLVTIGPTKSSETLRTGLAMGADTAIHIETPLDSTSSSPEPLGVAKVIQAVLKREKEQGRDVGLVIMGKQAIDDDAGQTGQVLAGLLGWGQACFASKVTLSEDGKSVSVRREIDGGAEELELKLPAIITTDLRLNEPRYASLPNIMKAKKKPIEKLSPSDLGVEKALQPAFETIKVEEPPARKGGQKVADVDALYAKLQEAGFA